MKRTKSHFRTPPGVQNGIFLFLTILFVLQAARWMLPTFLSSDDASSFYLDAETQALMDSLELVASKATSKKDVRTLGTYDANYLNDYRGYRLGLSVAVMDSLYNYRRTGDRLTSLEQFGRVTGIEGTALEGFRDRLRFPKPRRKLFNSNGLYPKVANQAQSLNLHRHKGEDTPILELNTASASDLQMVSGIGPVLSERIVKFRKVLGGFLHESQLLDVYGLPPEVAQRAMERFRILDPPDIAPLNLNTATIDELAGLVYLNRQMAEDLVRRRDVEGAYTSIDEITEVESIPKDKTARIALYLSF